MAITAHPVNEDPLETTARCWTVRRLELLVWLLLLSLCNLPLLSGGVAERLVFFPALAFSGEWERLLLAPFVHLSAYHLVLDGAAFLLLWNGLGESPRLGRWLALAGCWAGSLLAPLLLSPEIAVRGLCGLSGIAHGLFMVTSLEMLAGGREDVPRRLGAVLAAGILLKVAWELTVGGELVAGLHFGPVGVPMVTSHLGGVVGGVLAFLPLYLHNRRDGCKEPG